MSSNKILSKKSMHRQLITVNAERDFQLLEAWDRLLSIQSSYVFYPQKLSETEKVNIICMNAGNVLVMVTIIKIAYKKQS